MNSFLPVVKITFLEGVRSRALYGIVVLALLMCGANFLISGMVMREVGKVAVDVGLATTGFSALLLLLFVAIQQFAADLDQKTLYMILARPISRTHYLLGKYCGMILLILAAMLILSLAMFATVGLIWLGSSDYFERIFISLICTALLLNTLQLFLLCAVSFLFATFTSSSFLTLILTLLTYFIGHGLTSVKEIIGSAGKIGIEISTISATLVEWASWIFPNLALFNIRTQAAHGLWPEWHYFLGAVIYAFVYIGMVLCLAVIIFRRREFP